jgi:hypothetical protein
VSFIIEDVPEAGFSEGLIGGATGLLFRKHYKRKRERFQVHEV